jgi:hypothetical protein
VVEYALVEIKRLSLNQTLVPANCFAPINSDQFGFVKISLDETAARNFCQAKITIHQVTFFKLTVMPLAVTEITLFKCTLIEGDGFELFLREIMARKNFSVIKGVVFKGKNCGLHRRIVTLLNRLLSDLSFPEPFGYLAIGIV